MRENPAVTCHRKRTYRDHKVAVARAIEFSAAGDWQRALVTYRCPHCHLWHLTTAKTADQKKRARRWRKQWDQNRARPEPD